jgi:hypothetical protein
MARECAYSGWIWNNVSSTQLPVLTAVTHADVMPDPIGVLDS